MNDLDYSRNYPPQNPRQNSDDNTGEKTNSSASFLLRPRNILMAVSFLAIFSVLGLGLTLSMTSVQRDTDDRSQASEGYPYPTPSDVRPSGIYGELPKPTVVTPTSSGNIQPSYVPTTRPINPTGSTGGGIRPSGVIVATLTPSAYPLPTGGQAWTPSPQPSMVPDFAPVQVPPLKLFHRRANSSDQWVEIAQGANSTYRFDVNYIYKLSLDASKIIPTNLGQSTESLGFRARTNAKTLVQQVNSKGPSGNYVQDFRIKQGANGVSQFVFVDASGAQIPGQTMDFRDGESVSFTVNLHRTLTGFSYTCKQDNDLIKSTEGKPETQQSIGVCNNQSLKNVYWLSLTPPPTLVP